VHPDKAAEARILFLPRIAESYKFRCLIFFSPIKEALSSVEAQKSLVFAGVKAGFTPDRLQWDSFG